MPTVAAYTICLNEIKHIDRWLEANKDADLRVIVDTGSTDGTWERLQELADDTLKVHQIFLKPFRFDDARNAALNLVPADIDICVSVDMDEIPQEDFYNILRKEWLPEATAGWHWMDTGPRWQGSRIHKRLGFRWKYPCHEYVEAYDGSPEVVQNFDILISHKPDDSKSRGQYLPLLEMAVKETPDDARMWTYLTREYYFKKMWVEVIEASGGALECETGWNVEKSFVCRLAAQAAYNLNLNPEPFINEGLKHDPDSIEMWHEAAFFYYKMGRWQECWDAASKRLSLKKTTNYLCQNDVWDWRMYDLMAMAKWNLGDKDACKKWLEIALRSNPEEERLKRNMEFVENALRPHK